MQALYNFDHRIWAILFSLSLVWQWIMSCCFSLLHTEDDFSQNRPKDASFVQFEPSDLSNLLLFVLGLTHVSWISCLKKSSAHMKTTHSRSKGCRTRYPSSLTTSTFQFLIPKRVLLRTQRVVIWYCFTLLLEWAPLDTPSFLSLLIPSTVIPGCASVTKLFPLFLWGLNQMRLPSGQFVAGYGGVGGFSFSRRAAGCINSSLSYLSFSHKQIRYKLFHVLLELSWMTAKALYSFDHLIWAIFLFLSFVNNDTSLSYVVFRDSFRFGVEQDPKFMDNFRLPVLDAKMCSVEDSACCSTAWLGVTAIWHCFMLLLEWAPWDTPSFLSLLIPSMVFPGCASVTKLNWCRTVDTAKQTIYTAKQTVNTAKRMVNTAKWSVDGQSDCKETDEEQASLSKSIS